MLERTWSSDDADGASSPVLDDDGLLRVDERWVAIPEAQLPVLALLLARYGKVVPREAIATAYAEAGNSGNTASVTSVLSRLGQRLAVVGLRLHTVRGRGVMLVPNAGADGRR